VRILPGVTMKFMQLTVVFASLTTSVALVSVGPHGHGAHAKTTNMTRKALTPSYYVGDLGEGPDDCEAAIADYFECQSASAAVGFGSNSATVYSGNSLTSGYCLQKTDGQLIWFWGKDLSRSYGTLLGPVCKHASSAPPAAAAAVPSTAAAVVPATAANTATAPAAVSAVGDPHMQNILGQRFDLAQPGEHTLLQIPRGASASDALLRVTADAEHEGGACSDMYFKVLNITGLWVSAQQKEGYMYTAGAPQPVAGWRTFGKVEVKVAWGRTLGGVEYLNFMVRHLTRVGQDVGGLLGMDDYTQAAKRDPACASTSIVQLHSAPQEASFAMADM